MALTRHNIIFYTLVSSGLVLAVAGIFVGFLLPIGTALIAAAAAYKLNEAREITLADVQSQTTPIAAPPPVPQIELVPQTLSITFSGTKIENISLSSQEMKKRPVNDFRCT